MSDDRTYPERPIVGVGVVVFRGGDVLLIKRAKPPVSDRWSIPGGAQEIGETVREAARREVAEETGVEIEIVGLVDVVDGITRDPDGRARYHYTLVDFAARWLSGEARAASDAAAVRWVRPRRASRDRALGRNPADHRRRGGDGGREPGGDGRTKRRAARAALRKCLRGRPCRSRKSVGR